MISPVIDFGWFEGINNPLTFATRLPSQAAAARGLEGADGRDKLADVEAYATGPYLSDLLRGERDPAALARMSEEVAGFTGLDPAFVRRLGGRIDPSSFARERERAEGKISSLYDCGRQRLRSVAARRLERIFRSGARRGQDAARQRHGRYHRNRLGWPVDARYEILNEEVSHQWDWDGGRGKTAGADRPQKGAGARSRLSGADRAWADRSGDALFRLEIADRPDPADGRCGAGAAQGLWRRPYAVFATTNPAPRCARTRAS